MTWREELEVMAKSGVRAGVACSVLAVSCVVAGCTGSSSPGSGAQDRQSSGSAARSSTAKDPRKAVPAVTPSSIAAVAYRPGAAKDRSHFARVVRASAGLLTSSSVRTVTVSGRDVGSVAVYRVKAGVGGSTMFQDQYVVQLVNAVAGSRTSPKFVRLQGQVVALSTGRTPVAGWFTDGKVVLVYREGKTPDLTALAAGVRSTPVTG